MLKISRVRIIRCVILAVVLATPEIDAGDQLSSVPRPDLSALEPLIRGEIEGFRADIDRLLAAGTLLAEQAEGLGRLGEIYHAHDFHLAAEAAYRNARRLAPEDIRWAYNVGLLYQDLGRFEDAVASFGDVLVVQPDDLPALIRSGRLALELGQAHEGREFFERALAVSPQSAAAYEGLGRSAAAVGDDVAAKRSFERALEAQPQAGAVHYSLALIYRRNGELDRAKRHLELRNERETTFSDPRLDALARIPKISAANVVLAQASTPAEVSVADLASFALAHLGEVPGAVEWLTASIQKLEASPGRALERSRIHHVIAGLWIHRRHDVKAIQHLRVALELAPRSLQSRLELASALAREGLREEAVEHYDRVLELDPRQVTALRGRAATWIALGHDKRASEDFRRLLELEPKRGEPRLHLGMVLQRLGQLAEAEKLYAVALELGLEPREEALARANLGVLFKNRGDQQTAIQHLEAAHRLAPRNGAVEAQLTELRQLLADSGEKESTKSEAEPARVSTARGRSMLLITLDTTRADHLEPYGASKIETPALLNLAQHGVVFERAYATTPMTLPSHASIFTGIDPPGHGVRNNGIHYLGDEATTLTEILRDQNYRTAAFVSAAVLERRYGLGQGFEVYDDDLTAGRPKAPRLVAERPAGVTVTAARSWLDTLKADEPFFLWVHLFDPHAVYAPPSPYAERYRDQPYDGEIAYMDAEIGRLLGHSRLGEREPVLVMVIADHGESLGQHGEASHAMLAYDATLHIPWIVRPPADLRDIVETPLRLDQEVSQVDLLPTALDLIGVEPPETLPRLDGVSLAPAILGSTPVSRARGLYAETFVPFYTYGWAQLRSLRRDGWKLINGPSPELYYLPEDPGELDDRFVVDSERASRLVRALEELTVSDLEVEETAQSVDAETLAKLRSLGYLASSGGSSRNASKPNSERPDPKAMIEVHQKIERAGDALYRRDFELAVRRLRSVLKLDPDNLTALTDLARALGETGRLDSAIGTARRVLELDPESASAHLAFAMLLSKAGEVESALSALDASLSLDPRSLDARVEKVRVLYRLDRRDEAVALLQHLLDENPTHAGINAGYAELVELPAGELASAEARLRASVGKEPYLSQGWRVLGRVVALRDLGAAVEVYRQGLAYQPRDGLLHMRLGLALFEQSDATAESHLQNAEELLAEPPAELYSGLAAIEFRRGGWAQAEAWARQAVERDPSGAEGWNQLAVALEEQGHVDPALDAYSRALEARPAYWQARFNLGLLLRRQGRFREAALSFEGVLEQRSGHAKSHYELGVLYGGPLADRERSQMHLQACLKAEPNHPRAEAVRRLLAQLAG